MKKSFRIALLALLLIANITACKKTEEKTCSLATSPTRPPVEMNVVYSALQTGDGKISSLTYTTITGPVTVQNPTLPWTLTVPVLTTTDVSISATGTTTNGSLKILYDGTTTTSHILGSDYCEQQSN